ncbi:hypothetical protein [Rhodoferax sp.]|uniref:hypothetical protein n=1 Tax=Rhodoferax sp. TaxID=50421 RepID=UPI00374C9448
MPLQPTALSHEWTTLQNNYEQYERSALLVKLAAVVLCVCGFALAMPYELTGGIALLLWVQESIYRTYQSRLGERLLRVEALVQRGAPATNACQLHTEWLAGRKGSLGLLSEYLSHALRPTVAFPYAVLVLAELVAYLG